MIVKIGAISLATSLKKQAERLSGPLSECYVKAELLPLCVSVYVKSVAVHNRCIYKAIKIVSNPTLTLTLTFGFSTSHC